MTLNLEHIDELKKRANVSYGEAKAALEQCNGDLLEALIYLETQNKIKPEQQSCGLLSKMKSLFHKGNQTRFIIRKKQRTVLDLSVTVSVIVAVCAPYIVIPVLLLALVTGHRMKFEGNSGEAIKVNNTLDKLSEVVDLAKKKLADEDSPSVTQ